MQMKYLLSTTVLVSTLAVTSMASAGPAVTDGDFSSGLTGWTHSGYGTSGLFIRVIDTGTGTDATGHNDIVPNYNGTTHAAYFIDDAANESLYQSINLSPNTSYTLSYGLFATASGDVQPGFFTVESTVTSTTPNNADLAVTNSSGSDQVPVGMWATESVSFTTGADTSYLLNFDFTSGPFRAKDVLLADVTILPDVAIPEPISAAMFGVGLMGLGLVRRIGKAV